MKPSLAIVVACIVIGAGGRARADAEHDAYERARPVFEKYCTKCHSTTGSDKDDKALEHLDMSTYPFGGHHAGMAGMAVREALGASGEAATMPDDQPGAVKGDELALVLAWADAFDAAHPMDMGGMHGDHDMDMHTDEGMHDMPTMEMPAAPLGLSMEREGSGTAWQPDATPMAMHERMNGGWMLMLHYTLHAGYDDQGGPRGDDKAIGLGWVMGMATHTLAGGEFGARVMLSPEALLLGKRGYPLLLQTGEEVGGVPLVDRQHPHDLFMEVALRYARAITRDVAVEIYGGPSAEPAIGPVAFAHRPYALYDMTAPLGHHWQDSTHVSFGVVTAGVYTRSVKLEGSWFNGREPDENRYGFDLAGFDSYAARISVNPSASWSAEVSYGYLAQPEAREPGVHVQRVVASATYAGHGVDATAVLGRNLPSEGAQTSAALVEASGAATDHVILFGRAEVAEKLGSDLVLAPSDAARVFGMGSIGAGAAYELAPTHGVTLGLGVRLTADVVGDLRTYYGSTTPVGGMIYVEAHPARAR